MAYPGRQVAISTIAITVIVIVVIVLAAGAAYLIESNVKSDSTNTSNSQTTTTSSTVVTGSSSSSSGSGLILYSADAYVNETQTLENGFTTQTGVPTLPPKSAGSLTLAQEIAQGDPVSAFVSASKTAVQPATLKNESSGWAVSFATDQMAIVYSDATLQNSAGMNVIDAYNSAVSSNTTQAWGAFYQNLTSGSVKVGISNPNADPAGYRAWLVLEAAGYIYASGNSSYFVDRMLSTKGNLTGASAADLVAPLQAGQVQFLFIYKSSAISQKLNYFELPSGVNLGSSSYNSFYSQFTYTITSGVQKGGAIALFITVPKDSIDYSGSVDFVVYVVQNAQALKPFGLSIPTPVLLNNTSVPQPIQQLVMSGQLKYGETL
jgi:molybdate/tungstate transport system substrate-binding protein